MAIIDNQVLFDFTAPTPVSTLTVLLPFYNVGQAIGTLLFAAVNLDGTNPMDFIVETSEDGVHPDAGKKYVIPVPAGKQGSLEVQPNPLRTFYRLSAQTKSPTFPTVSVQWKVKASTHQG